MIIKDDLKAYQDSFCPAYEELTKNILFINKRDEENDIVQDFVKQRNFELRVTELINEGLCLYQSEVTWGTINLLSGQVESHMYNPAFNAFTTRKFKSIN